MSTSSNYSCVTNTNSYLGDIAGGVDSIIPLSGLKSQINYVSGFKDIISYKSGSIFGFSKIKAITIRAGINLDAVLDMRSSLKFAIQSFIDINGELNLKELAQFAINMNINETMLINLAEQTKIAISGNIDLTVWENTLLKNIDDLLLSELDDLMLSEIDRREGVNFILTKNFNIQSNNQINCILDLYLYHYAQLLEYDNGTLGSIDNLTLEELDKQLVL